MATAKISPNGMYLLSSGIESHFSQHEMQCPDLCGETGMEQQLIDTLEVLRETMGEPIIIDDGVRCAGNNASVGGAPHSKHLPVSQAADIRTTDLCALFTAAAKIFNGVGIYTNGSVHVDVGVRNVNPTFWYNDGSYHYSTDATETLAAFKALK